MDQIVIAIARKVIFISLLLGTYLLIDRTLLHGFRTEEAIKDDPKAIAVLLGLLSIAIALS